MSGSSFISTARGSTALLDISYVLNTQCAWQSVNYDTGLIQAVSHPAPGTPDGTYNITLTKGTIPNGSSNFDVVVQNGVGTNPYLTSGIPAHWLQNGPPGLEYETDQGAYASLVRHDLYYQSSCPYYGTVPDGVVRTAILDVFLEAPSPTCSDTKLGGNLNCGKCVGMARYSAFGMLAGLSVADTPISYSPPRGPAIDFTVAYSEKESRQPASFNYSNLGPKWTFNWLSYVLDDSSAVGAWDAVYLPGGGSELYPALTAVGQTSAAAERSDAILKKTASGYERLLPDGSRQIFDSVAPGNPSPHKVFMTQVIDPSGNHVDIGYDSSQRVVTITDAVGQVTNVYYDLQADTKKITRVTDPFGKTALFDYDTNGRLWRITDPVTIVSEFGYANNTDVMTVLTTPYGTTQFARGKAGTRRWIDLIDTTGTERVEYRDDAPGISATDSVVPSGSGFNNVNLNVANTFYWDRKAMVDAPGDYTKARVTHWLLNADGSTSGIPSSEKAPLENRVWYAYAGQTSVEKAGPSAQPTKTARVLGDGTTQVTQSEYNAFGNLTKSTDAVGRVTSYFYSTDGIDLLTVFQRHPATTGDPGGASLDPSGAPADQIASYTYDRHQRATVTDTSGQTTTYVYNATTAQLESVTNPKTEITTYSYGPATNVPAGYLAAITSPAVGGTSAVTSFEYYNGQVSKQTEPDNYYRTFLYDGLNRQTRITYPDGTYQQSDYADSVRGMTLDLTGSRDRRGRWTYRHYNSRRQMDSMTDPQNRTTLYGWCSCGSLESITDPRGKGTTFYRDLQGRVYQKVFADTTAINYLFEGQTAPNTAGATSRLKSSTDALNRRTNYVYTADNNVAQISYTNTAGAQLTPPTPTANFAYDPNYNRIDLMTDGTGATDYVYAPITTPPALGAGRLASVDGPLANDTITYGYDALGRATTQAINGVSSSVVFDALGRITTSDNALGHFVRGYDGVTPRLQSLTYPNGQVASYAYFGNNDDHRLQTLQNAGPAAVNLSKFDYTYDDEGQIQTWTKQFGTGAAVNLSYQYDQADQLTGGSGVPSSGYGYDLGGNRTLDDLGVSHTFNDVNQTQDSGYVYDLVGNLTSDGVRNYSWDAANRLTAIDYPAMNKRSEFTYDGLSRRVKIVEDIGSTVASTKLFIWNGTEVTQERGATNAATRRYFAEGEQRLPAQGGKGTEPIPYYYGRDHLGSIREVTDSTGALVTRYDYDAYGKRTKLNGTIEFDFGYTGHYFHAPSGLNLSLYRGYSPALGRWLSRDPIAEQGGLNLYAYVDNDAVNHTDPLGLIVGEGLTDVFWSGVSATVGGWNAAKWADQRARDSGFPGAVNGPQDAYRHCLWSCRMIQNWGEWHARTIGLNHENANDRRGEQSKDQRNMDDANNAAGRCAGRTPGDCEQKCTGLLMVGGLSWMATNTWQ